MQGNIPTFQHFREVFTESVIDRPLYMREGQYFFNLLFFEGFNRRVANLLRGSTRDPFYHEVVPKEVWQFVEEHWDD